MIFAYKGWVDKYVQSKKKSKSRTFGDGKLKVEEMNYEKIRADVRRHESKMR